MPLFDAIVLIIGIALITGYFVHRKSYQDGVEDGTEGTLAVLEREGLIVVDDEGDVSAPPRSRRSRK
jgi:hypothetical protein